MVRRISLVVLVLMLGPVLPGCNSVETDGPIGQPLPADSMIDLTGVWQHRDFVAHIRQHANGELDVALVRWADDAFEVKHLSARLTIDGDALYLNAQLPGPEAAEVGERAEAESPQPSYSFSRVLVDDADALVIWGANTDHFRQAVEQGNLAGDVQQRQHGFTVHVEAAAMTDYLAPDRLTEQFLVAQPVVVRRIASGQPRAAEPVGPVRLQGND